MNIAIITSSDRRQRYKFLSVPFGLGCHNVEVIKTGPVGIFILTIISKVFVRTKPELVIFIGIGVKELLACIILKLTNSCVMVRLGGDPLKNNRSMAASSLLNKKYVDWLKHRIKARIACIMFNWVDGVIVVNPAMERTLANRLTKSSKIFVAPQPCFGQSVPHEYSNKSPVELLTVTNLKYSEKAQGVIWIIEQLGELVRHNDMNLRLRIAGSGQHLSDIKEYMDVANIPDGIAVSLEGHVDELDEFYRRADVFIYHSIHDATPNVILESKRYGIPLLVNDCEEFRFIVEHDVSGFLYKDEAAFQAQLAKIIENESIREDFGKSAHVEHERLFSVDAVKKMLDDGVLHYVYERRDR